MILGMIWEDNMAITRLPTWREELANLRQQMDRLWNDVGDWLHKEHQLQPFSKMTNAFWGPAIELRETDTEVILKAQIPGVKAENLDVQITDSAVSIAGEHQEEQRSEQDGFYRSEFQYGQFQRIVSLPVRIDPEQVTSEFRGGVLTLMMPKAVGATHPVVKIDVDTEARILQAEARQTERHQHDAVLMRTEQDVAAKASTLDEVAREDVTAERQAQQEQEDKMRERALT
jgi:HSP20 family protein